MDIFLFIIGLLFCVTGLIGSFVPIIPGPITSWLGLLTLHFTSLAQLDYSLLIATFIIAITVFLLDLIIPLIGLKKLGGTKKGIIGASIGLLLGFFMGPVGMLTGPFIGALSGELTNNIGFKKAIKASFGTLIGLLAGFIMKFFVSFIFFALYLKETLSIFF
tara:strand:+ start:91 stop:576 length:486 start_codon:yes stop_codon:yes gene_type:complete